MAIKAMNGSVIVEIAQKESATESGIILPGDAAQEGLQTGIVRSCSNIKLPDTEYINIGDTVYFAHYAAKSIGEKTKNLFVLRQDEILARWIETSTCSMSNGVFTETKG